MKNPTRQVGPLLLSSLQGLKSIAYGFFFVERCIFCLSYTVGQDFFLPSEAYDLVFLKAKIAILCTKGFEVMDLTEYVHIDYQPIRFVMTLLRFPDSFKSVNIPHHDDPALKKLVKRFESCRPKGIFRSSNDEFLLCYDGTCTPRHHSNSRTLNQK